MIVLALNTGSSTLKFGLYRVDGNAGSDETEKLLTGQLSCIDELASRLVLGKTPAPTAIGHRIVHGGPALRKHVVIDEGALQQIEAASAFAPLHTPAALAVIASSREQFPGLPHVACFDTAFHSTLPDVARVLPIPKALQKQGIQRYGFHGLSCESIVSQLVRDLPQGLPGRLLIAHLGNGSSVTAVKAGLSVDTSMGLTPCGGLIMGTRSGDIDPGVLIHVMRHTHGGPDAMDAMLNRQSGLLGISGLDSDMRRLHEASSTNADARLAVHMYCVAVAKQLAAMATVLGGVDLIVFSGGIGENDAHVRMRICDALAWFGVTLDAQDNQRGHGLVSAVTSRCAVRVVASDEGAQMARQTSRLLRDTI